MKIVRTQISTWFRKLFPIHWSIFTGRKIFTIVSHLNNFLWFWRGRYKYTRPVQVYLNAWLGRASPDLPKLRPRCDTESHFVTGADYFYSVSEMSVKVFPLDWADCSCGFAGAPARSCLAMGNNRHQRALELLTRATVESYRFSYLCKLFFLRWILYCDIRFCIGVFYVFIHVVINSVKIS